MSEQADQVENLELPRRREIAAYFTSLTSQHSAGPIGELVAILATGTLEAIAMEEHIKRHGLAREDWYRRQVTDLGIGFISHCLANSSLSAEHLAEIHALNAYLGLDHGAYFTLRPAEVAAILSQQMDRILEDAVITEEEELYQVELQAAFGLGYDQYLALTRSAFERAHTSLTLEASGVGPSGERARAKLQVIEPLYRLVRMRARRPGALY
jgi:hypothetical protein